MSKMESLIKSEIIRLSSREERKVSVPLRRNVRLLISEGALTRLQESLR